MDWKYYLKNNKIIFPKLFLKVIAQNEHRATSAVFQGRKWENPLVLASPELHSPTRGVTQFGNLD
jgi:hypothetical protein